MPTNTARDAVSEKSCVPDSIVGFFHQGVEPRKTQVKLVVHWRFFAVQDYEGISCLAGVIHRPSAGIPTDQRQRTQLKGNFFLTVPRFTFRIELGLSKSVEINSSA